MQTAEVPEDALGKMGKCNSCGALVNIPERLTKVCFICGADVTETRHGKDRHGNYICPKCWQARDSDVRAEFDELTVECSVCHRKMPIGEALDQPGDPLCSTCRSEPPPPPSRPAYPEPPREQAATVLGSGPDLPQQATPQTTATLPQPESTHGSQSHAHTEPERPADEHHVHELARAMEDRPRWTPPEPRRNPLVWVVVMLALVFAAAAAFWAMRTSELASKLTDRIEASDKLIRELEERLQKGTGTNEPPRTRAAEGDWEEEHKLEILLIKTQAELLVSMGRLREGIDRYERLLKLAKGQSVSPALHAQIMAANQDCLAAQAQLLRDEAAAKAVKSPLTRPAVRPADSDPRIADVKIPTTRGSEITITVPPAAPNLPVGPEVPSTEPARPATRSIFD